MFRKQIIKIKDVETEKDMYRRKDEMNYWVYDSEGALIGTIDKSKETELGKEEWLRGVSCFVINEDNEILIEKRSIKGLTPGQLDLCSGHIDGNELAEQAMIRELDEELEIKKDKILDLKVVSDEECRLFFKDNNELRNFLITFFCIKVKKEDVNPNKEEVKAMAWLDMEKTFQLIRNGKTKFPKGFDYEPIFKNLEKYCKEKDKYKDEEDDER